VRTHDAGVVLASTLTFQGFKGDGPQPFTRRLAELAGAFVYCVLLF
jgi:hypothetical protein